MKRFRRNGFKGTGNPVFLDAQGQQPEGIIIRRRQNAIDKLLLEHHHGTFHSTGPGQEILEDGSPRGIGKIAKEFDRGLRKQPPRIPGSAVCMVNLHMGITGPALFLVLRQTGIKFHQNQFAAKGCGMFRQGAGSRPYLHHAILRPDFELLHNPAGHIFIRQEILPQGLAGAHFMVFQNIPDLGRFHNEVMFAKMPVRSQ